MKVILLSATYQNGKAVLKFYHPTSERVILFRDNTNHNPHCYVSPKDIEEVKEYPDVQSVEKVKIKDVIKDEYIDMGKVVTGNPLTIGSGNNALRDVYETWESDIKYYLTYLYDRKFIVGNWYNLGMDGSIQELADQNDMFDLSKIDMDSVVDKAKFEKQLKNWARILSQEIPDIRRMAFDIEVESTGDMPDPNIADQRVTAISFHGSDNVKKCFVLERDDVPLGKKESAEYETVWYKSEKRMLEDAFDLIDNYPLVLTYNGDVFDMPYLYGRAIRLGIQNNPFHMMKNNATLKRAVHIDLYGVFSNRSLKIYAFNGKYVENGLDSVSEALLGERKIQHEESINEMPLNKLAKYCYNDSRLTYELTHYNNNVVMNLLITLCRIGNMPIDDISRQSISVWIKSLLYFTHRIDGELIPRSSDFPEAKNSTQATIEGKKYQGAIVLTPQKGVHFNVTVMDFASLYPSIIKVNNISYDTVRCPHEECKSNKIPYTEHWSCTKKQGKVSLLIGSLKELRVGYFKKLAKNSKTQRERDIYDVIAQALKVFLNASYGVIGFESFPLYYLPTAEAVTAIGRHIISTTKDYAEQIGMTPIYGDTDSVMIRQPTKDQIEKLINYTWENYSIDLEIDKEYIYVVLSDRKKNYFGIKKDGKLDIKGLTGKKSNTPPYLREVFNDIMDRLKVIKTPEKFDEIKDEIAKRIKSCITNFDSIPLDKLAFKVFVNKEPHEYKVKPQVIKAAEQLEKEVKKGQFIQFVKTWKKPKVKPIQLIESRDEIDREKYMTNLETTLEQVTDPMGIDFDVLMGRGKATRLTDFV
ncbi:MAG: DNA-directed DNA polymerase I [Nitrosopumilaceae archaeon]|nr:DNA-directed DNA polymerase I [Nitrosopumilaceae archaeon]NIU86813.1 DNA-directed DNA polymerase I [Nitrosopumilaceae archaeon]NIX61010.1 DNA-directed DNA polymerase I [Nitrosopumilaceae archaeon]